MNSSTSALTTPNPAAFSARRSTSARPSRLRIFRYELWTELLKLVRMPAFVLPALSFPLLFYIFFGVVFGKGTAGTVTMSTYLLATYGAFGVIGAALFSLGVGVAVERGQGWMLFKRATPMPPAVHFVARSLIAVLFGAAVVALLFTAGATLGGVELAATTWLALGGVLIVGAAPFALFGMALGYLCGPNAAPAVINLIYLPMAFASGLWIPIQMLPGFFQALAPWLPAYHFAQLALATFGVSATSSPWSSIAYLLGFSLLCLGLAIFGYRRDEGKTFG